MAKMLEIRTFGGLNIQREDGTPAAFRTKKHAALLAFVVCTAKTHPRDTLAELFWPDRTQDAARSNLRAALTDLRRNAGPFMRIERDTVSMLDTENWWVDVHALEKGLAKDQPGELKNVLALYQGDFLDGLFLDSPEFENWLLLERERLRNLVVASHDRYIEFLISIEDYEGGLEATNRLFKLDQLREKTVRYMLQLQALTGNRNVALQRFESWRDLFWEELGLEPEKQTLELVEQVKAGRLRSSKPPSPTVQFRPPLPSSPTPFIGREDEVEMLIKLITKHDSRLITVVGPGGIGKSRLIAAVAERLIDKEIVPSEGLIFLNASTPQMMNNQLQLQLGLPSDTNRPQLLHYLHSQEVLLVIDDAHDVEFLEEILNQAASVVILAASREPLNIYGEYLFHIQGLQFEVGTQTSPATELFVQSAQRVNRNFAIASEEQENVLDICRLVDGNPLAIELAASWSHLLPPSQILVEIQNSLDFLETDQSGIAQRHRSMRAVIQSTFQRLPHDEQHIFVELSVFKSGFARNAALEVTGASLRLLSSLVSKSLVQYDAHSDRYRMHALLHQFCRNMLQKDEAWYQDIYRRHCEYFCNVLGDSFERLNSGASDLLAQIERDALNFYQAWYWAIEYKQIGLLIHAAGSMGIWGSQIGHLEQVIAAFDDLLNRLPEATNQGEDLQFLRALAIGWVCNSQRFLGKADPGVYQDLLHAEQLLLALNDSPYDIRTQLAFIYHNLAYVVPKDEAVRYQQASLKLFRDLGDVRGQALAHRAISYRACLRGDVLETEQHSPVALELFLQSRFSQNIYLTVDQLGWSLYMQNKMTGLDDLIDRMLVKCRREVEPLQTAHISYATARLLEERGRFTEGIVLVERSLDIYQNHRVKYRMPRMLVFLAQCESHIGNYSAAAELADVALSKAHDIDDHVIIIEGHYLKSQLALLDGDTRSVTTVMTKEFHFSDRWHDLLHDAIRHTLLSHAMLEANNLDTSIHHLTTAVTKARESYSYRALFRIIPVAAMLCHALGKTGLANELYKLAQRQAFIRESKWYQDMLTTDFDWPAIEDSKSPNFWETSLALLDQLKNTVS